MTAASTAPLLAGLGALLALGIAAWLYFRVDSRVDGRGLLFVLRAGALGLLVLLILDPAIPGEDPVAGPPTPPARWIVVDPDPALQALTPEGTLWETLLARVVDELEPGSGLARIQPERAEGTTLEGIRSGTPAEHSIPVGEPLLRLAEIGADSLILLSTLRMDPGPLRESLARLPVPLRIETVGEELRNAAIAELRLPTTAPPDEPLTGELVLVGEGGSPADSMRVQVWSSPFDGPAEGDPEASERIDYDEMHQLPEVGIPRTLELSLPPPDADGDRRYRARVSLEGDVFAADDERVRVVRVGAMDGGILLISVRPDWEPRTLLPVLERATGLEGAGFLRVGPDRFLPLRSSAGEPFEAATAQGLVERVGEAALVVLHGGRGGLPGPLTGPVDGHPRVLHLPADTEGAAMAGIRTGPPMEGEWRLVAEPPSSPLGPYLAGSNLPTLPPLTGVLPPADPALAGAVGFQLRRGTTESAVPGLVLRVTPEGRRAVALARDFWRWGVREGPPREAYRNLWSGVAGWLLASEAAADRRTIRPERPVLSRAEPLPWEAGGWEGAALEVEFRPATDRTLEGPTLRRDSVQVGPDGRFRLPPLAPGRYRYRVLVDPDDPGTSPDDLQAAVSRPVLAAPPTGLLEVERFQGALLRPSLEPEALMQLAASEAEERRDAAGGRSLRTHPLPWLLLLGLLSLEWIGRRRAGLR